VRRGSRVLYWLPLRFHRGEIDLGDRFDPLGHARTGAQEHAAIQSDPVGDVAVMAYKKENKQHQQRTDPKNDRIAFFVHWQFL